MNTPPLENVDAVLDQQAMEAAATSLSGTTADGDISIGEVGRVFAGVSSQHRRKRRRRAEFPLSYTRDWAAGDPQSVIDNECARLEGSSSLTTRNQKTKRGIYYDY
jgi:hypothetical protein